MAHAAVARREPIAAKVPEVTFLFWVIKLLTTAGGEAVSDYLALRGYVLAGFALGHRAGPAADAALTRARLLPD
jgi:uncharacterized membrane-anchored protein